MDISRDDRASQFLPFDSLNGFREAIKEKEIEYVEKKELSEEQIEEISIKINELEKDDKVKIIYYKNKQYKTIIGNFKNIDTIKRKIILNEDIAINFSDILKISII